jgi:serine/threonine protein kinase
MYEMISGRRIYEEDNEISLLDAARAGNFDDPRKHCPGLSQEVRAILIKALAKKPAARYQSAGALEEDLRGLLRSLQPSPDSQALGLFVRELFAERRPAEEGVSLPEIGRPSAKPRVARSDEATRSLVSHRPMTRGKIARFWWGVVAGLLVAGLGAGLLSLFSR